MTAALERRVLVVYAHPVPESFGAAIRDEVIDALVSAEVEHQLVDLYAEGFEPALTVDEKRNHLGSAADKPQVATHIASLRWATELVFVYPTWWSGAPAMLKGWFDRVWINEVAFALPEGASSIAGRLHNIDAITVVTTHGSGRLRNRVQGRGGRRMILRGLRTMCGLRCRTHWMAMHDMDRATDRARSEFLERVRGHFTQS